MAAGFAPQQPPDIFTRNFKFKTKRTKTKRERGRSKGYNTSLHGDELESTPIQHPRSQAELKAVRNEHDDACSAEQLRQYDHRHHRQSIPPSI
jgi:hypothetical protein